MLEWNTHPLGIYFNQYGLPSRICWNLYVWSFPCALTMTHYSICLKKTDIEVYVYSYVGKRHDYMHAVCPSIWLKQQNQKKHNFWAVESFLLKQMSCRKIMVRLNLIDVVLHLFILYFISARIVLLFQEFCLYGNSFWRSKVPLLKANVMEKNVNEA